MLTEDKTSNAPRCGEKTTQPHRAKSMQQGASESAAQKVPESIEFFSFHLLLVGIQKIPNDDDDELPAVIASNCCAGSSRCYMQVACTGVLSSTVHLPLFPLGSVGRGCGNPARQHIFGVFFFIIFSQLPRNTIPLNCCTKELLLLKLFVREP